MSDTIKKVEKNTVELISSLLFAIISLFEYCNDKQWVLTEYFLRVVCVISMLTCAWDHDLVGVLFALTMLLLWVHPFNGFCTRFMD